LARFFFNLRHRPGPNGLAVDPEGDELLDVEQARAHAISAARDLIARTRSDSVRDWFACAFEIVDEAGRHVLTVSFNDTIQDNLPED